MAALERIGRKERGRVRERAVQEISETVLGGRIENSMGLSSIKRASVLTCFVAVVVVSSLQVVQVQAAADGNTTRPLIGIYTQDSPSDYDGIPGKDDEYIAASYAKLVESAGARPVPVSYNLKDSDLRATLDLLDGFVFPGGGMDLSLNKTYALNAKAILDYAQSRPSFVVVGICLGFELISAVMSQNEGVLSGFDAQNLLDLPNWEYQSYYNSKLSQFYPPYSNLQTLHVFENHKVGVSVDDFVNEMSGFFNLLATSLDRQSKQYVSAMEGKDFPIFGFQFHPEKNTYEWKTTEVIPHDYDDLEVTRGLSKLLAFYSRQSSGLQRERRGLISDEDVNKMVSLSISILFPQLQYCIRTNPPVFLTPWNREQLIYNVPVVFTAPYSDKCGFEQVYFFPKGYNVKHLVNYLNI